MRKIICLLSVLTLVFPIGPASTEENRATLEERVRDMPAEAARFLETKTDSERMLLHPVAKQEPKPTQESEEVARLRARIRSLTSGSEISVVLRGGQRVHGELVVAQETDFTLRVTNPEWTRGPKVNRSYRYDEVESADLPEPSEGMPIGVKIAIGVGAVIGSLYLICAIAVCDR